MDTLLDDSLVQEFVTESREHLDAIEPDLLELESMGEAVSADLVNRVFRAIHSIKGGAGFLAYESLKHLSHQMESVLMRVRDGELRTTAEIVDVLLRSVDRLREMLSDLGASDAVECRREIRALEMILNGEPMTGGDEPAAQAGQEKTEAPGLGRFDWSHEGLRNAASRTIPLYLVTMKGEPAGQAEAAAFCDGVAALGDAFIERPFESIEEAAQSGKAFRFLFSTVLEEDLVPAALERPAEAIALVSIADAEPYMNGGGAEVVPEFDAEEEPAEEPAPAAASAPPSAPLHEEESAPAAAAPPAAENGLAAREEKSGARTPARDIGAETLRVRVDLLSRLMNAAGELVLTRNQFVKAFAQFADEHPGLASIMQSMDRVTADIQEGVMQTRLQPIGSVISKFPRVVRDISRKLGKQIEMELHGVETEVDKSVIELIGDPMLHIIRNCADHAIETPAEREAAGKNPQGRIVISAFHQGGQVLVTIADDGRGIDPDKIRTVAVKRGVVTDEQARRMSPRDLVNLIFAPGFSTAETITDVSGRGVGMDVVRTNIEKLGGSVNVDSAVGAGTTVTLQIPLTLAIVPSLVVGIRDEQFAIPQMSVEEIVWVRAQHAGERIERIDGNEQLHLRERLLPLLHLARVLDDAGAVGEETEPRDYKVVVVRAGRIQYGLVVDRLFDSEDIVMKPLSPFLKQCRCFSGATITGEGRVIPVLDVLGIATVGDLRMVDNDANAKETGEAAKGGADDSLARMSVVLFKYAANELFAAPQDTLLRLERIRLDDIQSVGSQEYVNYHGHGLPIVRLDSHLSVQAMDGRRSDAYLLIPKPAAGAPGGRPQGGVLVSEIVDTADVTVALEEGAVRGPGVLGSAVLSDRITTFVDLSTFVDSHVKN